MDSSKASAHREVLVVVPTLNEVHNIERVVTTLNTAPPSGACLRIVVVDGGSRDGTQARVQALAQRHPNVCLLPNPRRIQSAAVNLAARVFGEGVDVLVRCDAHAHYPRGFIARLLGALDHTGADAVVVPMDSAGTGCLQRAVAWVSDTPVGSGGSAHRGGRRSGFIDHGHHAAFRMESFLRAGGYDESFTHNEDAELDCRQRRLGARIYLDADNRLTYYPRDTWRGLARQYFAYGSGRSRTMRRHPGTARLRQLAPPLHLALSALAVGLSPWQPWLLAWPLAYVALLALTSLLIAVRQRSPCGLLAGPAAGLMHLSWAAGFFSALVRRRERPWRVGHGPTLEPLAEAGFPVPPRT